MTANTAAKTDARMSQVSVTINGRQYRMACEDGQESHLMQLAKLLDERIGELRGKFGQVGDSRLTVMAALTVADELAEAEQKITRIENELAALQDARMVAADHAQATQTAIIAALNAAAERIEGLTRNLNQTLGPGVSVG
jgi:cell division protein ZapA